MGVVDGLQAAEADLGSIVEQMVADGDDAVGRPTHGRSQDVDAVGLQIVADVADDKPTLLGVLDVEGFESRFAHDVQADQPVLGRRDRESKAGGRAGARQAGLEDIADRHPPRDGDARVVPRDRVGCGDNLVEGIDGDVRAIAAGVIENTIAGGGEPVVDEPDALGVRIVDVEIVVRVAGETAVRDDHVDGVGGHGDRGAPGKRGRQRRGFDPLPAAEGQRRETQGLPIGPADHRAIAEGVGDRACQHVDRGIGLRQLPPLAVGGLGPIGGRAGVGGGYVEGGAYALGAIAVRMQHRRPSRDRQTIDVREQADLHDIPRGFPNPRGLEPGRERAGAATVPDVWN